MKTYVVGIHWKHISEVLLVNTYNLCFHGEVRKNIDSFYTPPHNSGGILWFHVGRPCPSVCLSVVYPSIRFSFLVDNLSKHQWIFTNLGMCIDIVEIWFHIANGQISSNFYGVICPKTRPYFRFRTIT